MSKSTLPVSGGAMSGAVLAVANLTDPQTGRLNREVFKGLVRREAMQTFGSTAPRFIREAAKLYRDHADMQAAAWRQRNGLPVATSLVSAFGSPADGVRRSAF